MAAVKRKADVKAESKSTSKAGPKATNTSAPPAKKQRKDDTKDSKNSENSNKPSNDSSAQRSLPKVSLLKDEERAFPRGGASVLTPLEQKQIHLQATRDALFEEATGAKRQASPYADDEDSQGEVEQNAKPIRKKSKTKDAATVKKQKTGDAADAPESKLRAEGLKPKRMIPGTLVLGQVSSISSSELTLDLPNNIKGSVPITAISTQLNKRLQDLLDEEEDDEVEDSKDINLQSMFTLGQYLRAAVQSTSEDSAPAKTQKKLQLSLIPSVANKGLEASQLPVNATVQAAVASVEDHGVVVDLGLEDKNIKGFVSSKHLPDGKKLSDLQAGTVMLCCITSIGSNGRVVKLSADHSQISASKKLPVLSDASTIDPFLPGTATDFLVTRVSATGIQAQVLGSLNVTIDLVHSGAATHGTDLEAKYPVGKKIKARIVYSIPDAHGNKLGASLLEHILHMTHTGSKDNEEVTALVGSTVESTKVLSVLPAVGVYVDLGERGQVGFVHVSRLSDDRVDSPSPTSGPYKIGSIHAARILDYNALDGIYVASFEQKVLAQRFLRSTDVPIGSVVKGKIEKIIVNAQGVGGLVLELAHGITGFVPASHMSDVKLQNPERKFKEGLSVTARVLSVDREKNQIRLTLKKTLVNSDLPSWTNYESVKVGSTSVGTITKFVPDGAAGSQVHGALVTFYGNVRGFLPTSQMSESFIDPVSHFRIGQTVTVHAMSVDQAQQKLTVSCRLPSASDAVKEEAFVLLKIGDSVSGTITEKSSDDVTIDLTGSGLRASLSLGHMTDGSDSKNSSAMKRLRVGQEIQGLIVLDKFSKKRGVTLSNKPSLIKAAQKSKLPSKFDEIQEGEQYPGYVGSMTDAGIFVRFAGGLTGLLPKNLVADDISQLPQFGLLKDKSITVAVFSKDHTRQRFLLTMKPRSVESTPAKAEANGSLANISNPVDGSSTTLFDFKPGKITKAQITAIKSTQLNVKLADHVQGRIDASEIFANLDGIEDVKEPLKIFQKDQVLPVRVLGVHDARNHKFLPISHRQGKVSVFELSAKIEDKGAVHTYEDLREGSPYLGFVNNVTDKCLWVSLSPNVRGRINRVDVSDDVSVLNDMTSRYPIGAAIRVFVKKVDPGAQKLDLSAKSSSSSADISFDQLSEGMILTGKVTRSTDRGVMVRLSSSVAGYISLTQLADDYDQAKPSEMRPDSMVRVSVIKVDKSNKKVWLSARPSKVFSSSLSVKDPAYSSFEELKVNDVVRGFVSRVADIGLFVVLSDKVTAFVRVSELSDAFVKDWKSEFHVDQLVRGKVIAVDASTNHLQISLKASILSKEYVPTLSSTDLKPGMVITGKVRKVEDFGAFIVVDNSQNVSGLCHRSEIAEKRVEDVRKLYNEGDAVKAIVLKVEPEQRRVSFGLKASYFETGADEDDDNSFGFSDYDEDGGVDTGLDEILDDEADEDSDDPDDDSGVEIDVGALEADEAFSEDDDEEEFDAMDVDNEGEGLDAGGFDLTGSASATRTAANGSEDEEEASSALVNKKKKKRHPEIKQDLTGELDAHGPRTPSDFERLLLTSPDNSELWMQYMALQLELSDIDAARGIAKRALETIPISHQDEKLNIWIARLNLENEFGDDTTLESVFNEACKYADPHDIHLKLIEIYVKSTPPKIDQADALFRALLKRKTSTRDSSFWINYASFLFDVANEPVRARGLLQRAIQSVPPRLHANLTMQFARLEFRMEHGDPERGRTIFENLISLNPKDGDVWDVLIALEKSRKEFDKVRELYTRVAREPKIKKKWALGMFRRWREFEGELGNGKGEDQARDAEAAWVEKRAGEKEE